jgi:putative DNA primase/helicase
MKNFPDLFQTYQGNVTSGMLREFAESLKVSVESLEALGVGYYPLEQAWVFAERDAKGKIIGLLKRYSNGKKRMVDSSRRGLYYILNPEHKENKNTKSLLHDFVRISEAKVQCPICGKPDWCLVSRDNPHDPSEVICNRPIAEQGNIARIGDAGWLHILDKNRAKKYTGKDLLLPTEHSYLVVEGATDVLAAYDLGFVAVGRPSAQGGIDQAGRLLFGKRAIVIGENDSGAGKQGMEMTFAKLQKACKKISKLLPPPGVKDFRDWVDHGLTERSFFEYLPEHASSKTDDNLLEDPTPLGIAEQWLKEKHINGIHLHFRHHRSDWWVYNNGQYDKAYDDILDKEFYDYLEKKYYIDSDAKEQRTRRYVPTEFGIRKIKHALLRKAQILNGPDTDEPFIISGCKSKIEFDRQKCIIFKNGILNIETRKLSLLSPEFFTTSTIPYNYDEDAACPLWERTVKEWFNDDKDSILLLSQWYGYNFLATNYLEAMMFLFGQPGSGKSTITEILSRLLGPERCSAIEFKDLGYTHGMQQLVGKYAAVLSEDQVTKRMDNSQVLQMIKRLTGNNRIVIRPKYKDSFTTRLFTRLTYECDTLPRFIDNSQALQRRLNILYTPNSFRDSPNVFLKTQLLKEIQGIANWSLRGLQSLLKSHKFVQPKASDTVREEFQYMTSPIAAMAHDCLEFDDENICTPRDQLYDLHRAWFEEAGYALYNRVWFFRTFRTTFPNIDQARPQIGNKKVYCYRGVKITPDAFEKYLGRPK